MAEGLTDEILTANSDGENKTPLEGYCFGGWGDIGNTFVMTIAHNVSSIYDGLRF